MGEYLILSVPEEATSVSVKLDDEGVVVDLIDEDGEVIASTWKLYEEFDKIVEPLDSR